MRTTKAESRASILLAKYWLNTLTENERIELEKWLQVSPTNKNIFNEATNINGLVSLAAALLSQFKKRRLLKPTRKTAGRSLTK